jgi:hypothetical protein
LDFAAALTYERSLPSLEAGLVLEALGYSSLPLVATLLPLRISSLLISLTILLLYPKPLMYQNYRLLSMDWLVVRVDCPFLLRCHYSYSHISL